MAAVGDSARRGASGAGRLLLDAAGFGLGGALGAVAAMRRGKAVHPHGVVHSALLRVTGSESAPRESSLLRDAREHQALVRFSRSLGLPRPLPDLLGMSIRVLDAYGDGGHQDFLLVTSADLPVVRHLFLPASDVQQRAYTSALSYRAGRELFLVGALPDPDSPKPGGRDELDRLRAAAATGRLRFHLAVASGGTGFRPVGELLIGRPLPESLDALRFSPWNSGGGIEPAGALNRLRDYAYPLSQTAWRTTRQGADKLQDDAERLQRELR